MYYFYVYLYLYILYENCFSKKVYENGKDTGETLVYISRKEMESNYGDQPVILEKVGYLFPSISNF